MTAPAPPPTVYPDHYQWFDLWLSPHCLRPTRGFLWCAQWPLHPEADFVVEQLWKSWEQAAAGVPMSETFAVWMRDFYYPLLDRISSPEGTFSGCDWAEPRHQPDGTPLSRA